MLGLAPSGSQVIVEGLDPTGAPIATGNATLANGAACVCVSRNAWYTYATWRDQSGAYHDSAPAQFFVRQSSAPGVEIARPLTLDHARVVDGDTLRATVAYQNSATASLSVRSLSVVARPPGATHANVVADFSSVDVNSLAPGQVIDVDVTRTFQAGDPPGAWAVFARRIDALGLVHDGPEVTLTVGGADPDPLVPVSPAHPDRAWLRPPQNLHVTASYRNATTLPLTFQSLVTTVRRPGGSNGGGPFDDLEPRLATTTVGPGQTLRRRRSHVPDPRRSLRRRGLHRRRRRMQIQHALTARNQPNLLSPIRFPEFSCFCITRYYSTSRRRRQQGAT